jgi:hypothetical protein
VLRSQYRCCAHRCSSSSAATTAQGTRSAVPGRLSPVSEYCSGAARGTSEYCSGAARGTSECCSGAMTSRRPSYNRSSVSAAGTESALCVRARPAACMCMHMYLCGCSERRGAAETCTHARMRRRAPGSQVFGQSDQCESHRARVQLAGEVTLSCTEFNPEPLRACRLPPAARRSDRGVGE